ncbi:MAG TPA: hypothetical protein VMF13_24235 [Luteitalea sp.]|nr:hypothetical protein [Luteitalea sp.]
MLDRPGARALGARAACVLSLLVNSACATPPQKEMDQADGAITTARAAGAAQYASDEFTAAETALRRSHEAVEQRDYRQALNHALDARERAQTAAREAADKKAIARGLAERAVTAAELALAPAVQRVKATPAAPSGRRQPSRATALKALQLSVSTAEAHLQEARTKMQAQDFDAALKAAAPVPQQIREAIAAYEAPAATGPAARGSRRGR